MNLINNYFLLCDAPRPWGVYFQDTASPQMEALVELHDNIMFYLAIILFGIAWTMVSIIRNYIYNKSSISNKYLNHGTLIELIWTITPALILILIAFPSFKLLYLMDEVTDPNLTVFVENHQWYWSYQYPDFPSDEGEELKFDSYLVPESDLEEGALRMLEVDNRVILPEFGDEVEKLDKYILHMSGSTTPKLYPTLYPKYYEHMHPFQDPNTGDFRFAEILHKRRPDGVHVVYNPDNNIPSDVFQDLFKGGQPCNFSENGVSCNARAYNRLSVYQSGTDTKTKVLVNKTQWENLSNTFFLSSNNRLVESQPVGVHPGYYFIGIERIHRIN